MKQQPQEQQIKWNIKFAEKEFAHRYKEHALYISSSYRAWDRAVLAAAIPGFCVGFFSVPSPYGEIILLLWTTILGREDSEDFFEEASFVEGFFIGLLVLVTNLVLISMGLDMVRWILQETIIKGRLAAPTSKFINIRICQAKHRFLVGVVVGFSCVWAWMSMNVQLNDPQNSLVVLGLALLMMATVMLSMYAGFLWVVYILCMFTRLRSQAMADEPETELLVV